MEKCGTKLHTEGQAYMKDSYSHSPLSLLVNESQLHAEHKVTLCIFLGFVSVLSFIHKIGLSQCVTHLRSLKNTAWFRQWNFPGSSVCIREGLIVIWGVGGNTELRGCSGI